MYRIWQWIDQIHVTQAQTTLRDEKHCNNSAISGDFDTDCIILATKGNRFFSENINLLRTIFIFYILESIIIHKFTLSLYILEFRSQVYRKWSGTHKIYCWYKYGS